MKARSLPIHNPIHLKRETLFSKDIWHAEEIGLKPSVTHSTYRLKFGDINPQWFKDAIKQFIYTQANTKAFFTCCSYIAGLRHFGKFITIYKPDIKPEEIDRAIIVEYLSYLPTLSIKAVARQLALIHLRTFLDVVSQEEWIPITKIRLIYGYDLPKIPSPIPRFIPEIVMSQLNEYMQELPENYRRLIYLLRETGRRVSEICLLPYDCLHLDEEDSFFL